MTVDAAASVNMVKQQVSKNWWILLVQGIATILLGVLLLINPATTLIAIAWVLGIFWLVGGVLDVIGAFTGKNGNRHWFWGLLGGILGIIVGLILIVQPVLGAVVIPTTLTLLLGLGAALGGVFNIIGAIMMRKEIEGEFWMIVWGAIMLLLGIWILFNLGSATIAYVFVMAIFMIVGGVVSIFGAFRLRSLGR
ncbi:MAG: HdeD family acid-resistance protein [Caldilineaceae bacterium]